MAGRMLFFDEAMTNWWLCRGLLVLIYGVIALILYKILRVHMPKDGKMNISHREYISAGLIAVAVFAVSNMSFLTENTPFPGDIRLRSEISVHWWISAVSQSFMRI